MTKMFQNFYCSGHVIKYVKQKTPKCFTSPEDPNFPW